MKILLSMGLHVELPMFFEMDNNSAAGMANKWSVGGTWMSDIFGSPGSSKSRASSG